MATQIGAGEIYGTNGTLAGAYSIAPNMKTLRVSHSSESSIIKGQTGEVNAIILAGDFLECEFSLIPQGTTQANALTAGKIPASGSGVTISGLPIIAIGPFTDGLNTNSGNTQPWIYMGGGSLNGSSEAADPWVLTLPLRRYIGITSAVAIT